MNSVNVMPGGGPDGSITISLQGEPLTKEQAIELAARLATAAQATPEAIVDAMNHLAQGGG